MKQQFIKQEKNQRLILFFAGWGSDENLFNININEEYDCLLCFDYHNLEFDYSIIKDYIEIKVLAWSMGVWVANTILTKKEAEKLKISETIAFNGTIFPIDDNKGIPADIYKGTMDNFSAKTLAKFRRRICGNLENTKKFLSHTPYRSIESLSKELESLWDMVHSDNEKNILKWDIAVAGTNDKIFPYANQMSAWKETCTIIVSEDGMEHYDPEFFFSFFKNPGKYESLH